MIRLLDICLHIHQMKNIRQILDVFNIRHADNGHRTVRHDRRRNQSYRSVFRAGNMHGAFQCMTAFNTDHFFFHSAPPAYTTPVSFSASSISFRLGISAEAEVAAAAAIAHSVAFP